MGLIAEASAVDTGIHKRILCLSRLGTITLIISNEKMEDVMKIARSLENSGISIKDVTQTIKKEASVQKIGFLAVLLDTSGANLLRDVSTKRSKMARHN